MKCQFESEAVRRYYLKFDSEEEFDKALTICKEKGSLRFTNGDPDKTLVGRLVRASRERRYIEVDAAIDPF